MGRPCSAAPSDAFDRVTDPRYLADANVGRAGSRPAGAPASRARVRRAAGLTGRPCQRIRYTQLVQAVEAVCRSWMSPRAREYRQLNGVEATGGTAVLIQTMVFGNAGGSSGSGVGFTRNPTNGEDQLYIDFLFNAQGEDVVSGRQCVTEAARAAAVLPAVVCGARTRQIAARIRIS